MRIIFIVPGKIDRLTGGSIYDRHVADQLRGVARLDIISLPDPPYFIALLLSPFIALWLAARRAVRQADVILEDGWSLPMLVVFNRLLRRARIAVIVHQVRWVERQGSLAIAIARRAERRALQAAHLIFTVSKFMRREIQKLIGESAPVVIAPPGSDATPLKMDSDSPPPREEPVARLLFVGNCARRKGLAHLIEALARFESPRPRLDIVGRTDFEPSFFEELRRTVARHRLEDRVIFHGGVSADRLAEFYRRANVFVMPSLYEGYGIVYAEAVRAGLPIVATDTGPVREIVLEGENALIVPPADASSLAEALRRILSDEAMRLRFSARSRELAAHLPTWRGTVETIVARLRDLAAKDESS